MCLFVVCVYVCVWAVCVCLLVEMKEIIIFPVTGDMGFFELPNVTAGN